MLTADGVIRKNPATAEKPAGSTTRTNTSISRIMLVFGVGLAIGNLLGGRLADHGLGSALIGTLATLAAMLRFVTMAIHSQPAAMIFMGLLGAAAFATVAPLQIHVLEQAGEAGRILASSLNIAAFNLGTALGA